MKEEKLFDMVKNIDDDLICEMLDYSPETEEDVCEGVLCSVPEGGKRRFWKFPVTAAALLLVVGIVLFVINRGVVPDDIDVKTDSEQTDTDNTETFSDTEASGKTEPLDYEGPRVEHIVPDKAVFIGNTNVLFTDQYPDIPKLDLSEARFKEAQFKEMSTLELCEYYGLEEIASGIQNGYYTSDREKVTNLTEVTDENASHGIYTFPDGGVYDINTFTFETEDFPDRAKRFTVTAGKKSIFGLEYDPRPDFKVSQTVYYNEEKETFFMVYETYGAFVMISGEIGELSDFDDMIIKELFYDIVLQNDEEYWQGVPYELILFQSAVLKCVGQLENITLEDWNNVDPSLRIIPNKIITFGTSAYVLYTDQYPDIYQPDLSEAEFTEISISELCEYYGLYNIPYEMRKGVLTDAAEENASYGIYTFPDGNVYDINTFTFKTEDYDWVHGKKFTVTIGRSSTFGHEYNQEPEIKAGKTVYYNKEDETFFTVFEKYGSCIMISGKAEELSGFDDPMIKEAFYNRASSDNTEFWQGIPCELELFTQSVALCVSEWYKYEQAETDTDNTEAGEKEAPARIVPNKAVPVCLSPLYTGIYPKNPRPDLGKVVFIDPINVLYTDLYPKIPQPDLSEAQFTEMSAFELCEYYGLGNIQYGMATEFIIEVKDKDTSHGIYTLPDGSTYDINTFTFETPDDDWVYGKKFTVTVGRSSTFGKEYNQEPEFDVYKTVYYNEEDNTFFTVIEKYGSCIMISGKAEELSDFGSLGDKDAFYAAVDGDNEERWKGVPCELELFVQNVIQCVFDFPNR